MLVTMTASRTFGASHLCLLRDPVGSRLHFGQYTVSATLKDPAESQLPELDVLLFQIVGELDGRRLEDMMPGASPEPTGLARWVMERLAINFPRLWRVEVAEGSLRVTVERDTR